MNNTSKLLEKVLSKLTNELDARDIDKIMNDDDGWHIRQLLLDMESEARLDERAKCVAAVVLAAWASDSD